MEWVLVKTLLSLAAVLGLMVGLVFLLRKFLSIGGRVSSSEIDIRVLGTRTLQPKRSVCVIGVLNKVLVVGISEQGMHTLTEFAPDEVPAEISASLAMNPGAGSHGPQGLPFLSHLSQSITRLVRKEKGLIESTIAFPHELSTSRLTEENLHGDAPGPKPGQQSRKAKPTYA
jgi:flagellar biogenesis protein FliO